MELQEFFKLHREEAIAFSGGVDSAYLLYAALKSGARVRAYFVKSAFQPQFELDDALQLADQLHAQLQVLELDVLASDAVAANPHDRCYHCKRLIFETIAKAAKKDGFSLLLDGTNASDAEDDRPGMRALRELHVCSPLRLCGLRKEEIRRLSKKAGLFTWNKPAYACLATRIPAGEQLTKEKLSAVETAEQYLASLGFTDFRVRTPDGIAKLQVPAAQMEQVLLHREEIVRELKKQYTSVLLDLEERDR